MAVGESFVHTPLSAARLPLAQVLDCLRPGQLVCGGMIAPAVAAEMTRRGGMLVVFDVDHFKHINDRYGHLQGDVCLAEIADCIKKAYASCGYCYRIGGDEFCVLLKDAQQEAACAQEFLRCLEERRQTIAFLPTVSFGAAALSGGTMEKVKEQADRQMYRHKKNAHPSAGV